MSKIDILHAYYKLNLFHEIFLRGIPVPSIPLETYIHASKLVTEIFIFFLITAIGQAVECSCPYLLNSHENEMFYRNNEKGC